MALHHHVITIDDDSPVVRESTPFIEAASMGAVKTQLPKFSDLRFWSFVKPPPLIRDHMSLSPCVRNFSNVYTGSATPAYGPQDGCSPSDSFGLV